MTHMHGDPRQTTDPWDVPVSILMPVRNEADFISRCLCAVLSQDYPHDLTEIIVVDGMSTDGTQDIVRSFQEHHPNLRLIQNPSRIVPAGLNLAITQARGEIVVRVDGHCEIAPDYVSQCVMCLLNDDIEGVGGPIDTVGTTNLSKAIACAMSSSFGVGNSAFRTMKSRRLLTDTIAFPAYMSHTLKIAGPYDEELVRNQDDEYNYRLREMGGRILLSPDVRSRYFSRSNLRSLWRQYFQYGFWKVRVMQKHPRQMRSRQFAPPMLIMALLVSGLFAFPLRISLRPLAAVGGLYMFANLGASVLTAKSHGWKYLLMMPPAFAAMHVAYGLGFLLGLAKFWNRWGDKGTPNPISIPQRQGQGA